MRKTCIGRIALVLIVCLIVASVSSCSTSNAKYSPNETSQTVQLASARGDYPQSSNGEVRLIEQSEYYEIVEILQAPSSFDFYVTFFDTSGAAARVEGPLHRLPEVTERSEKLLRFTLQTGTGLSTQWGYYYDVQNGTFSDVFRWIFDDMNEKVAYGKKDGFVVCDIFSPSQEMKEFTTFSSPLSSTYEPIKKVRFLSNDEVTVTYRTSDESIVEETLRLK